MENVLNGLQPELVFKYFEEISKNKNSCFSEREIWDSGRKAAVFL